MDIYLINLDRRPDRLAHVTQQLESLGMPFSRFPAIDGQRDDANLPDVSHLLFIVNQKKNPVRSEMACAASHIAVWKRFLDSDADYALVLEDDINIHPDLSDVLKQVPALGLDFLNLSSNVPYALDEAALRDCITRQRFVRPSVFQREERRKWRPLEWRRRWRIFQLHPMANGHIACECDPAPALGSGYILSRKAARSFLDASERLFFPIDLTWRYSSGMLRQGFLVCPIVVQSGADSDIMGRFDQGKISLQYRLLRPILKNRRLRRRLDVLRLYGLLRH